MNTRLPNELWNIIFQYRRASFIKARKALLNNLLFPKRNDLYVNIFEQHATYAYFVAKEERALILFTLDYTQEHESDREHLNRLFYTLPAREYNYKLIDEKTYFIKDDGTATRSREFYY